MLFCAKWEGNNLPIQTRLSICGYANRLDTFFAGKFIGKLVRLNTGVIFHLNDLEGEFEAIGRPKSQSQSESKANVDVASMKTEQTGETRTVWNIYVHPHQR
jgi:hypothetical protein